MNQVLMPAAQYLRMSTDHQQYSLDNQADANAQYAARLGFQNVKPYSDLSGGPNIPLHVKFAVEPVGNPIFVLPIGKPEM